MPMLNEDQQNALKEFEKFMLSDEREMIISGMPGSGKTYFISYILTSGILDKLKTTAQVVGKKLNIPTHYITATTNKAVSVLNETVVATTIHSLLGLVIKEAYDSSKVFLKQSKPVNLGDALVFIDECSMIDRELLGYIRRSTPQAKVVYIGDRYQLPPVQESISQVFKSNLREVELHTPVRNVKYPKLVESCAAARLAVKHQALPSDMSVLDAFQHIQSEAELNKLIQTNFMSDTSEHKILAYTNKRVSEINTLIRSMRNLPSHYVPGEYVTCNSYFSNETLKIPTDTVLHVEKVTTEVELTLSTETVLADLIRLNAGSYSFNVHYLPYEQLNTLSKKYVKNKDWRNYYALKETCPDLRPFPASTVHKSQGSTYKSVILDLKDISTCRQYDLFLRMLYVGVTRAAEQVYIYE